ncbi:extracellular solute-binding protein [Paenibacillus sp. GYB004]|uniref:extracellular solute-binding protein n=1 Tax=Paenibacillus sp. GYB004 TaxID=2994393 RepID=UPI002F96E51C
MSSKPSRSTFRDRLKDMVDSLRQQIESGQLEPDAYLPAIPQLSKQYQLSVNSVQKGLEQLVQDGLVERIPRVGIRVRAFPGGQQPVTLSVGYYPSMATDMDLPALIGQFEANHPHIQVRLIPLQFYDYLEVATYYLENNIVDVIAMNYINFGQLAEKLAPIGSYLLPLRPAEGIYDYLTPPFTYEGELYVQPVIFSPVVMAYNKRHFAELDWTAPPREWTWSRFMELLHQLEQSDSGKLGFYFYPVTDNRWPVFMLQSGLTFGELDPRHREEQTARLMDSIQSCYDLVHRQRLFSLLLSEHDIHVERLFAEQKISVIMTTYFNLNKLRGTSVEFDLAPLPYVNAPKTLLLSIGFAINRHTPNPEAAELFIRHLTSEATQRYMRTRTYSIPALRQAAEQQDDEQQGDEQQENKAGGAGIYRPDNYRLFKELEPSYSLLTDLHMSQEQKSRLQSILASYLMGIETRESTEKRVGEFLELLGG